ncbi:MAG: hypothetical protein A3F11_08460 [Gammaproteobacteria bacterium RIFCSPHIGHO2_12_FULL_37_14]|nr:MAG: hypothetical protein A3F11_08460 [Gammaproteobacteria bacterium RIFCSPHIGHO2_12_FULL_37_14]
MAQFVEKAMKHKNKIFIILSTIIFLLLLSTIGYELSGIRLFNNIDIKNIFSKNRKTHKICPNGITITIKNNTYQPILALSQRPLKFKEMGIYINGNDYSAPRKTIPGFGFEKFKYTIINNDTSKFSKKGIIYLFIQSRKAGQVYAVFPYVAKVNGENSDIRLLGWRSGNIGSVSNQQYKLSANKLNNCQGVLNVSPVVSKENNN